MEEECTAILISSTDLKGSEFVCRCHPEDALRWSLYSGDYVILKGGGEVECLQASNASADWLIWEKLEIYTLKV